MEHVSIVLFNPRNALENHHYGAPLGAHVYGFEGVVQN
jgi:hypothetical protein